MHRFLVVGTLAACTSSPSSRLTGDSGAAAEGWPAGVTATAPQPCDAPRAQPAWEEEGAALGLPSGPMPGGEHDDGSALVVHDLDEDGFLDVILGWSKVSPRVAWGGPDGFTLVETGLGADALQPSLADLDGDGDLDVLFGSRGPRVEGLLVDGRTLRVTLLAEQEEGLILRELEPGDLDGDGHPELLATYLGAPDRIAHLVDGRLVFDPVLPETWSVEPAFDGLWFDHQGDGDLDAYVVNDVPGGHTGNRLWQNDGGTLSFARGSETDVGVNGMGADAGDLNGDGLDDLVIVGAPRTSILLQQPGRPDYVDVAHAWGFALLGGDATMGWASVILDADNDGDRDILVTHGDLFDPMRPDWTLPLPITLYERTTDRLTPLDIGLATTGSWRGAVPIHLNEDGVLDFVVLDVVGRPAAYRSTGCTANSWLTVWAPPGSRVVVEDDTGRVQHDTVRTGTSFGAASSPQVHVGLGTAEWVERVEVTLPSGEQHAIEGPLRGRRHLFVDP